MYDKLRFRHHKNSNKPQRHDDLNKLITATGRLLGRYKINDVAQRAEENDADFAKRIDVANPLRPPATSPILFLKMGEERKRIFPPPKSVFGFWALPAGRAVRWPKAGRGLHLVIKIADFPGGTI